MLGSLFNQSVGATPAWTNVQGTKTNGLYLFVGHATSEESAAQALALAEQDAITQMIKIYFGVSIDYSLNASESMSATTLDVRKTEKSERLHLSGILRTNTHVIAHDLFHEAWVMIACPEKVLVHEKARINQERHARTREHEERTRRAIAFLISKIPKPQKKSPIAYPGMPIKQFLQTFPAPETIWSYPFETRILRYSNKWKFCTSFIGCSFRFTNGRLESWEDVRHTYIDATIGDP